LDLLFGFLNCLCCWLGVLVAHLLVLSEVTER
jgi:hypothetical protein